ncbi:MAG: STAS domain-containing protein [Methanomassiliicoccus sp.]|nr:STAS domain-containing protein [Methanomassiliicoccus sp.]
MEIKESDSNGIRIIDTIGRIDAYSAKTLEDCLKKAMGEGHQNILVDLKDTDYISSGGLRVFLATLKELRKNGGSLKLCCLTPAVLKIFKLAGFTSIFSIFASEQEALGS